MRLTHLDESSAAVTQISAYLSRHWERNGMRPGQVASLSQSQTFTPMCNLELPINSKPNADSRSLGGGREQDPEKTRQTQGKHENSTQKGGVKPDPSSFMTSPACERSDMLLAVYVAHPCTTQVMFFTSQVTIGVSR